MRKPRLLYVSPVVPAVQGTGLAMRAGNVLEALAEDYVVDLVAVPVNVGPEEVPPDIRRLCNRATIVGLPKQAGNFPTLPRKSRYATPELSARVADVVDGEAYQVIHVFRLYTVPYISSILTGAVKRQSKRWLDLDDFQSEARAKVVEAALSMGDFEKASAEASDVACYVEMERQWLKRFDRVYVSNGRDQTGVRGRYSLENVFLLPNGVRFPKPAAEKSDDGTTRFLFAATLNYPPNEEAILFFCSEVLPKLRSLARRPFQIQVVGHSPSQRVLAMAEHPEVTVEGNVSDMGPCYRKTDVGIVPLRYGSGTRIKILEAASYRRPVVSTDAGIDGLAVRPGKDVLTANSAEEFSRCCARLMDDPGLSSRLADEAYRWVRSFHTLEAVRQFLNSPV